MGLFDRLFGKKEKADWSKAVRSQPNLGEKLSLLSLAEGEETILPKEPQKEYTIDGQPSEEWKLVLMKRTRKGKCFGVGHADYASALEKLAPYILDQDKTSVLVRALTGEELVGLIEVWGKRPSYYPHVAPLPDKIGEEIQRTFQSAVEVFGISDPANGEVIAREVRERADHILETGELPEGCKDLADAAVSLGVLFGQALCIGRDWEWGAFGDSPEKVIFGVISPGKNFCNAPMPYLLRILQGKNTGLDGKHDNTVLLLYNMLETIDLQPEEKTHFPVA